MCLRPTISDRYWIGHMGPSPPSSWDSDLLQLTGLYALGSHTEYPKVKNPNELPLHRNPKCPASWKQKTGSKTAVNTMDLNRYIQMEPSVYRRYG